MAKLKIEELTVTVPNIGHIVVTGPTQCGKTIIMDRIEKALKKEFGANVISPDLDAERNGSNLEALDDWEKEMVGKTTWVLSEVNRP